MCVLRLLLLSVTCGIVFSAQPTAIVYAHFSDALGDDNLDFFLKHGGVVTLAEI